MFTGKYQTLYSKCSILSFLLSFIAYPHTLPSFSLSYCVDCLNLQQISHFLAYFSPQISKSQSWIEGPTKLWILFGSLEEKGSSLYTLM